MGISSSQPPVRYSNLGAAPPGLIFAGAPYPSRAKSCEFDAAAVAGACNLARTRRKRSGSLRAEVP